MTDLIFVYNANSGLIPGLMDAAHKLLAPSTYPCKLCALTHGTVTMRREWRDFVDRLELPVEFLHRDELRHKYGISDVPLPAVLSRSEGGDLAIWVDADTLQKLATFSDLIAIVTDRLSEAENNQAKS